jgi:hypothetical protein
MMVKLCNQPVDLLIRPIAQQIGVGEFWEGGFHGRGLSDSTLFDAMVVIRWKSG